MRDALLAALDSVPKNKRAAYALQFCVEGLESIAKTSATPLQREFALAYADACRDLVPADVRENMARAKRSVAK